jgi:hypothetical protein
MENGDFISTTGESFLDKKGITEIFCLEKALFRTGF